MSSSPARSSRLRRGIAAAAAFAAAGAAALAASTTAVADTAAADPKLAVYVEVNSNDLANVADYTLAESGRPAVDLAMIFAANINYDGEQAVLHLNDRVTETLQDAQNQIRPLQAQGTKVLLSVLGNHQGAGFANFTSYADADAFAAQLADTVTAYGLDGIDFDDEWSNYGANGTPQPNPQSFGWLASALRDRLGPDKLITLYAIGPPTRPRTSASSTPAACSITPGTRTTRPTMLPPCRAWTTALGSAPRPSTSRTRAPRRPRTSLSARWLTGTASMSRTTSRRRTSRPISPASPRR
ncbi:glycosyl hydrolase family 18 protein [Microbacterium sp. str. 'China']|uniref:glycosyl hydrolase family 18 protein n=1 Tax=Microbacterium sp. str. 'China' TaxID=2103230 RepID=UPI0018F87214|nr:glycosyl hydrolase family 18 protein [Microbacterium sp. str. 'China']